MDLPSLALAAGVAGWSPIPVDAPKSVMIAPRAAAPIVVESPTGAVASWNALIGRLLTVPVVAVGEKHDDASHHLVQAAVLGALADRDRRLVVGLEMVPQDQQPALDDFLSGKTSEADFSAWWKKIWGFDFALYKPIFDAARLRGVRVVGLNVPSALIRTVFRKGLEGLSAAERASLPASIAESADARYRDFVRSSFASHRLPPEALARLIQCQAVWNEAMGAKVAEWAASTRVLVIAGQGHVLWRAGIPESAARRGAGAALVVLPYPLGGESMTIPEQYRRLRDAANGELAQADDFVLLP